MKQVLQSMHGGKTSVEEIPDPLVRPGTALVRTACSLVSAGTERMVVEFAEKNLLEKVRSRPDLAKHVIDKALKEGPLTALDAAFNRLDQPMVLGYSSSGVIEAIGPGLTGFSVGDRVACAGGGFAVHAELAVVPQNLLARVPESVELDQAAFATLGAIAMHGFRLAQPQIGESVAIIGMGLLGLLAAQISRAAGCQVLGIDTNNQRVQLAESMGFQAVERSQAESACSAFTHGNGADIVLICADTSSDDPVELAARIARDRAVVVAVGAVGLKLQRKLYYDKELDLRISRSYGPGRYDPDYEERGKDYPSGYVRWTEGRNIQAFVDLLAGNKINLKPLITHRFPIDQAEKAYELITGKTGEPFLGVLLTYPEGSFPAKYQRKITYPSTGSGKKTETIKVGVLGAGNFANAILLPAIQKVGGVDLIGIASAGGVTAQAAARKFGFSFASTDENDILSNPDINTVLILTRHQHHTRQVMAALQAGKNVYCEKPLALTEEDLSKVFGQLRKPGSPYLSVGFNRRFAPLSIRLKEFLASCNEPFAASYRINAGYLAPAHWTQDPAQGGGRIIGEGCHFIDYLTFLAGEPPAQVDARALPDSGRYRSDNVQINLTFPNGSLAQVLYLANGDKGLPKERLEVHSAGRSAILDDYRELQLWSGGSKKTYRSLLRQDKGHQEAWQAFVHAIKDGGQPSIPYDQLYGSSLASIQAARQIGGQAE
jgi:predicted dehydrogenase/threonine dehydrogenase-like Zn-dependent dehydrogenase